MDDLYTGFPIPISGSLCLTYLWSGGVEIEIWNGIVETLQKNNGDRLTVSHFTRRKTLCEPAFRAISCLANIQMCAPFRP